MNNDVGITMKRMATYLFYVLVLMFLVYFGITHLEELRVIAGREFNPLPPIIFTSICSIIVGAYLALPGFLSMLKKEGKVHVNWLKILIVGIPTLLVSFSGSMIYYVKTLALTSMFQWIYFKFNMMGTVFIGIACGYTILNSFAKEENADSVPTKKSSMAKIISLVILVGIMLYIPLSGVIHPIKLVAVHADIVETDDQGYLVNDGEETVYFIRTQIKYRFEFENIPHSKLIRQSSGDQKIIIEPKESLQSKLNVEVFEKHPSMGISANGNMTELELTYTIGSIDPKGNNININPPPAEVLKEIKDSLYDVELVIELNDGKVKQYNLLDYKDK